MSAPMTTDTAPQRVSDESVAEVRGLRESLIQFIADESGHLLSSEANMLLRVVAVLAEDSSALSRAEKAERERDAAVAEQEEFGRIGERDGYEKAVQDLDLATGGDGEFKGSTFPGETVDVPVMKARIIERFAAAEGRVKEVEEAWADFARHTSWSIQSVYPEEDEPYWAVFNEHGGRSDREWDEIGRGDTPEAALSAARRTLNHTEQEAANG